jgi:hypothetical protein
MTDNNLGSSWTIFDDADIIPTTIKSEKTVLSSSGLFESLKISRTCSDNTTGVAENELMLSISEIIALDYTKLSELKILEYQKYIASQIKKYVSGCNEKENDFDITLHVPKLKWLSDSANFLAIKRNMRPVKHVKKQCVISRNSYKFCPTNSNCIWYHEKSKKCNGQHFVYSYVKSDIDEILDYLDMIDKKKLKTINLSEILISINTVSFVFNHMFEECAKLNDKPVKNKNYTKY